MPDRRPGGMRMLGKEQPMGVFILGVGYCGSFPTSSGLSYRELIARAAAMAYQDAGISAEQVDGAVSVEEDFVSGYSIADEYSPDQICMVRKPIYTVPGDFLQGIGSAAMQIRTGRFRTVAVESYSKASNILTKDELLHFAYDPIFNRFGVTPHYLAGIEMQSFLGATSFTAFDVAEYSSKSRSSALSNPLAPYASCVDAADVLRARQVASPVTELMIARPADAAIVVVLGSDEAARACARKPIRVSGIGWASGNSVIERRDHRISAGTAVAADMAYEEAAVRNPEEEADVAYVSDIYAHRALMHMEALGLSQDMLPRINPDGGAQANGDQFEATSGARLFDAVRQLRGEAGAHQVKGACRAIVQGWRGVPTDTCAVAVLEQERS